MAKELPDRKRTRAKSRDEYRRQFEERRAKRATKVMKVTPFDPQRYLEQVRLQAKAMIHTVAYAAALTGILIYVGHALGAQAVGGFAALLAIGSVFYYLLRVWDIDLRELGRVMMVVGVYLSYFITWFMTSYLVSNPPFLDSAPPEIREVSYWVQDANGSWVADAPGALNTTTNQTAQLRFRVVDNSAVTRVTLSYSEGRTGITHPPVEIRPDLRGYCAFTFQNLSLASGPSYHYIISAWDPADHLTLFETSFSIA